MTDTTPERASQGAPATEERKGGGGEPMSRTTLKSTTGPAGARVLGLGAYRPRRRVTNDELAQTMDTNDEWIQTRVGIAERRWAAPDETLVDMAVAAGGKALAASGLSPDVVDLVIVASASLRVPIPGIGPQVAHRLRVTRPRGLHLHARCARFFPAPAPSASTPGAPASAPPSASRPTRSRRARSATRSSSASSGSPTSPTWPT